MQELLSDEAGVAVTKWHRQYGGAIRVFDYFGHENVHISDSAAINHVLLTKSSGFIKPPFHAKSLSRMTGNGLASVEGEMHTKQRRIMAPAFTNAALKQMEATFWEIAARLRDQLVSIVASGEVDRSCFTTNADADEYEAARPEGETMLDPQRWLSRATLDVIGLVGFGHAFNSLDPSQGQSLADAFAGVMTPKRRQMQQTVVEMMIEQWVERALNFVPWLFPYLPDERVQRIFAGLSHSRKAAHAILNERNAEGYDAGNAPDILSVLLKSNKADAKLKMSDAELLDQVTTMILAGHETTATSLAFALKLLAEHPNVQRKLRDEIVKATQAAKELGKDGPDGEDVSASVMPYLEAFTKENLRFESPIATGRRQAVHDELIPLNTPIKAANGQTLTHVPIKQGQLIFISIRAANFNEEVFGEDVDEFKPERWLDGSAGAKTSNPGVHSQLMTFGEGPRACIGWKLSVIEFKVILVTLLQTFEFAKRDEDVRVVSRTRGLISKPVVAGEEEMGYKLPLKIKLLAPE